MLTLLSTYWRDQMRRLSKVKQPRMNLNINDRDRVITMVNAGSSVIANVPLW